VARFLQSLAGLLRPKKAGQTAEPDRQTSEPGAVTDSVHPGEYWGPPIEIAISDPMGYGKLQTGWVLIRSATGVGIHVERPLPEGRVFQIRFARESTAIPSVLVRAVSSFQHSGRHIVRCEYVEEVPPEVLFLLR
jgi:hypothetical protein